MSEERGGLSLKRIAAGGAALVVCPCHVLYGGAALLGGVVGVAAPLAPEVQDGLHALYLPLAGLGVALWLRRGSSSRPERVADEREEDGAAPEQDDGPAAERRYGCASGIGVVDTVRISQLRRRRSTWHNCSGCRSGS